MRVIKEDDSLAWRVEEHLGTSHTRCVGKVSDPELVNGTALYERVLLGMNCFA